ncbi:hypothetical protein K469DRAFT_107202 [Zopfia rhizophila CBS 207.26]|uniref:Uncharacterized protein n=1 Tax=Zopfia rhizophila CBS 207.26 TaxID=1314779 RepID=A0A6A6E769_9PEZI|nr:hypothetical protein K469DRAFT_107202 [Zopfia rhizophila CBS 207.26]
MDSDMPSYSPQQPHLSSTERPLYYLIATACVLQRQCLLFRLPTCSIREVLASQAASCLSRYIQASGIGSLRIDILPRSDQLPRVRRQQISCLWSTYGWPRMLHYPWMRTWEHWLSTRASRRRTTVSGLRGRILPFSYARSSVHFVYFWSFSRKQEGGYEYMDRLTAC